MATTPLPSADGRIYVIQPGDDLAGIAARHGVSIQMLNGANPEQQLSARLPVAGRTLEIPPAPMSALATPDAGGFSPIFAGSGNTFGFSGTVAGRTTGIEWNPGAGSVKGTLQAGGPLPVAGPQPVLQANLGAEEAVRASPGERPGEVRYEVSLTREMSLAGGIRESTGGATVQATRAGGERANYTVELPSQASLSREQALAQASRVDPFDPTTLPVGGAVRMNQQDFTGTSLEASFARAGAGIAPGPTMQRNIVEAEGTSFGIRRTSADQVQVVVGPNQAVEAFNGVGIGTSLATAMAGRQDALGHSALQTATFNIGSPDGQAAYAHFLSTGEVARQSPGVSDVASIQRIDMSSETRLRLALGPEQARLQADLAGQGNTGSLVRTTYADGSRTDLLSVQYGQNVPLQVQQRFDAEGNELPHMRSYRFEVDTRRPDIGFFDRLVGRDAQAESRNMAENLNAALGHAGTPQAVQAGQRVTVAFDEAQMRALMARVQAADPASVEGRGWQWLQARADAGDPVQPMEFATALARRFGNERYAFTENLSRLAMPEPGDKGARRAIDATLVGPDGRTAPASGQERAGATGDATSAGVVGALAGAAQEGDAAFRRALEDLQHSPLGREFQARVDALAREQENAHAPAAARHEETAVHGPDAAR